ncbi:MAG: DUF5678 domain-containing protein [Pyrinomonadaceae bacterium]
MQTNLEQVTEIIRMLPLEDFDKVREVLDEQERNRNETDKKVELKRRIEKFKRAEKWLAENRENYMNEWVCLEGDKLIAHGTDALEVDRQAKKAGIEAPFLEHIVEEKYPFGGW